MSSLLAFDSSSFVGMVNFLQLTMLQLGGEQGDVEVGPYNVDPNAIHIFLSVIQTINWLGGIWGLMMLAGMVGNILDTTQVIFTSGQSSLEI